MRARSLCLLLAIATVAAPVGIAPAAANARSGSAPVFTASPCPSPVPRGVIPGKNLVCGLVTVPRRYEDPKAGSIQLAVAVRRAQTPGAADPIVLLAGGPGEKVMKFAPLLAGSGSPFAPLFASRDVVFFDQRGVGQSRPALECPEYLSVGIGAHSDEEWSEQRVRTLQACGRRLDLAGRDLGAYDTLANVRDLDLLRQALGYKQVNLFGVSYGAYLGLEALRGDPQWVRSAVLSSSIPAEKNWVEAAPTSFQHSLDALDRRCRADSSCDSAYPDLTQTLNRIVRRVQDERPVVRTADPKSGRARELTVLPSHVSEAVFSLLYSIEGIRVLPRLLALLDRGHYDVLYTTSSLLTTSSPQLTPTVAPAALRSTLQKQEPGSDSPFSLGMMLSVLCAEQAATTTSEGMREIASDTDLAPQVISRFDPIVGRPLLRVCASWPVERGDPRTFSPVNSRIPTLVISGQLDPITPPSFGRSVARRLANSTVLEVAGAGHAAATNTGICGTKVVAAYVARPGSAPDTSCLAGLNTSFLPPVPEARASNGQSTGG